MAERLFRGPTGEPDRGMYRRWLAGIADGEAGDPVVLEVEDVEHGLVLEALGLVFQRPAIEVVYFLDHLDASAPFSMG